MEMPYDVAGMKATSDAFAPINPAISLRTFSCISVHWRMDSEPRHVTERANSFKALSAVSGMGDTAAWFKKTYSLVIGKWFLKPFQSI
jgi:hypothetical protein